MYSNDVRVANTAAPSFQTKANVTQYGWTDVDQGHYNQLIQYVDECRKIWKDLSEKIEYIEGLLVEVANIDEQVKFVNQKANEVAEDARQTKTDVIMSKSLLNQMILLNTDFQTKYTDFVDKYPDFLIKYEETVLNAAHAAVSATEAEGWFNKTYDLYLDLKNGQVYRGTWNPATGAYPAHGGTNSVWDVILDAGLDTVPFNGFDWHNGDRLLYILADNKYDQLRTGSGVLSVNGKTGAVTLTPADVGALGATEPSVSTAKFTTPVKIAGKEFDGTGDLEIYPNDIDAASKYITVNGQGLDKNVILTSDDVGAIGTHQAEVGNGLVMRVGGARDQAIQAALADATGGAYMAETPPANPIPGARWFDTNDGRTYLYYVDGDSSQWIEENPQSPDIIQTSPLIQELANDYRLDPLVQIRGDFGIFHEGAPPTPAQVGAVSLLGQNVTKNQHGTDFTNNPNGQWIASNHGSSVQDKTASRVVLGTLNNGATIGGHFSDMSDWSALYLNTYPQITANKENAPVIMANPKRQIAINNDSGVATAIQYPIVSKGARVGSPNWWIGGAVLRFMDGRDLMNAATNGLRLNPDWAYLQRFKFSVRLSISAPSIAIWSQTYGFEVYSYQTTNSSDTYEIPCQFDCHASAGNRGTIKKQMVPVSENGGMPYFELHYPGSWNVPGAADLTVQLVIIAQNLYE